MHACTQTHVHTHAYTVHACTHLVNVLQDPLQLG